MKFDESMERVNDIILKSDKLMTMGISKIKRMEDRDVLFAGANGCLFVVEWSGSRFVLLNKVEEIHSCKYFELLTNYQG